MLVVSGHNESDKGTEIANPISLVQHFLKFLPMPFVNEFQIEVLPFYQLSTFFYEVLFDGQQVGHHLDVNVLLSLSDSWKFLCRCGLNLLFYVLTFC